MKAGEHGPDKLYDKFTIIQNSTGKVLDQEFIFVLRPETDDKAAQAALVEYARSCERTYPELARQIREQIYRIRRTK